MAQPVLSWKSGQADKQNFRWLSQQGRELAKHGFWLKGYEVRRCKAGRLAAT
jgi:hypothetical protein